MSIVQKSSAQRLCLERPVPSHLRNAPFAHRRLPAQLSSPRNGRFLTGASSWPTELHRRQSLGSGAALRVTINAISPTLKGLPTATQASPLTRQARERFPFRDEEAEKHINPPEAGGGARRSRAEARPTSSCPAASSPRGRGSRSGPGTPSPFPSSPPSPLPGRAAPPAAPVPDQPIQTQPSRHHLGQRRHAFPPEGD